MDWIERGFGISPDGGDGSTELLYIGAVLAVLVLVAGHQFVRNLRANAANHGLIQRPAFPGGIDAVRGLPCHGKPHHRLQR